MPMMLPTLLFIALALLATLLWKYMTLKESVKNQEALYNAFNSLSKEALSQNNRLFLDLAATQLEKYQERAKGELEKKEEAISHMITPVKETLTKLDSAMKELDKERKGQHESLSVQLKGLAESERILRQETQALARALKAPSARGKWGELQLKRIMELAGMLSHCDFFEQCHIQGEEKAIRPDIIVRLPGNRFVAIDAKVPLEFFLDAMEKESDEERKLRLKDHARTLKHHITQLGKKKYWESLENSVEFVVLFLPSETFFSAALESDPTLIELALDQGVILTTPTSLIGLLRAIAYGWKQEALSQNARRISELGSELHKRLSDMTNNLSKLGRSLSSSVESFNRTVGSFESRVLVSARKFEELGAASDKTVLEAIEMIEKMPRLLADEESAQDVAEDLTN